MSGTFAIKRGNRSPVDADSGHMKACHNAYKANPEVCHAKLVKYMQITSE